MDEIQKPSLSKRERRELKREEKKRMEGLKETGKIVKSVFKYGLIVLVIVGIVVGGWYLFGRKTERTLGDDLSRLIPDGGRNHIGDGEAHEPYNSNPPTSGPHWVNPVRDGIYDRSQPDEGLVHSLEHGRIWISHRSSLPESAKKKLERIAKSQVRVILTVRDANDSDIAIAAWTRLDTFDLNQDGTFDEGRVLDFIERFRDKGPEYVPQVTGKVY